MRAFIQLSIFVVVVVQSLGCRSTRDVQPDSRPMEDLAGPPDADPVARGEHIVATRGCRNCHGDGQGTLSGSTSSVRGTRAFAANLTPDDETGIGEWRDSQLARAIREGLDDNGEPLCPAMPQYDDLSDSDVGAVIAYLRLQEPIRREIPESICPPIKGDWVDWEDAGSGSAPSDSGVAIDAVDALLDAVDALLGPMDATLGATDAPLCPTDAALDAGTANLDGPRCTVRINEIQTAGAGGATDEFIELFNPCAATVSLKDHWLLYRSAAGTHDVNFVHFGDVSLPASGLLVCAPMNWHGAAACRYSESLAAAGGGLSLWDGNGQMLDAVGWGTATNSYVIGRVAPAPPSGKSLARVVDGMDSGDNASDFHVAAPTPGAPNW